MLLTYRFDENGDLTEVIQESRGSMWDGYVTRWVITDTPESDIQAWVEAKLAEE